MITRSAGLLLHPTSLPGRFGVGDIGPEAERFLDWAAAAGQSWWQILPLGPPTDQRYAEVRHHLARQGTPIGPNDLLIAAHTLAADLTLVTANTREFERVPSLRVENWLLE